MNRHNLSYDERKKYRDLVSKMERNKDIRKGNFPDLKELDAGWLAQVDKTTKKFEGKMKMRESDFNDVSSRAAAIIGGLGVSYGALQMLSKAPSRYENAETRERRRRRLE